MVNMRYFVEQVRAVRIDEFQFKKHTVFEVAHNKALDLYWAHVTENTPGDNVKEENVAPLFERGQFVNVHTLGLLVYGKNWSDSELFKQRLEGNIAKEVWK